MKLLEHNNLLLKPLTGRKIVKVHKNLYKLVDERKEHLHLNDSNPFAQLQSINDSYRTNSDNRIKPNPGNFADYEPTVTPSHPPAEPDQAPDAGGNGNNEESDHSFHSPPSSPPHAPPPPPPPPHTSGRLTHSKAEAAGISLPTPSYQEHTIEFDVGKSGREKKKMAEAKMDDAPESERHQLHEAINNLVPSTSSSSSSLTAQAAPAKKKAEI